MKEKIEEILHKLLNTYTLEDEVTKGVGEISFDDAVKELLILIETTKREAVMEFAHFVEGNITPETGKLFIMKAEEYLSNQGDGKENK